MNGADRHGAREWPDPAQRGTVHIDVRGLPPPQPLLCILALVRRAAEGTVIVVHHERDPLWLYPELAELGWRAEPIDGEPGEVRLRLAREPA